MPRVSATRRPGRAPCPPGPRARPARVGSAAPGFASPPRMRAPRQMVAPRTEARTAALDVRTEALDVRTEVLDARTAALTEMRTEARTGMGREVVVVAPPAVRPSTWPGSASGSGW